MRNRPSLAPVFLVQEHKLRECVRTTLDGVRLKRNGRAERTRHEQELFQGISCSEGTASGGDTPKYHPPAREVNPDPLVLPAGECR